MSWYNKNINSKYLKCLNVIFLSLDDLNSLKISLLRRSDPPQSKIFKSACYMRKCPLTYKMLQNNVLLKIKRSSKDKGIFHLISAYLLFVMLTNFIELKQQKAISYYKLTLSQHEYNWRHCCSEEG